LFLHTPFSKSDKKTHSFFRNGISIHLQTIFPPYGWQKGLRTVIHGLYFDKKLLKYEGEVNLKTEYPPHPLPLPPGERGFGGEAERRRV